MDYFLHILVMAGIYAILTISCDLLAGHTGLLSIAHASFFGLGAYTSALLSVHVGIPFLIGVFFGMIVALLVSFVVSLPSFRLYEDYFVIATFGFQMILYNIFNNWTGLTGGAMGISAIPQPEIFGWPIHLKSSFAFLTVLFAGCAYLITHLLITSPFGRVLRAIREDEIFAQALGKNTVRFKVAVFAVSAALAASAGSLYAHYTSYIDPSSFTVVESILVISMVIIGGAGSSGGALLGAILLVILPEALRFLGLPSSLAANLRQIFYGLLLIGVLMVRPRGLVGRYSFGR